MSPVRLRWVAAVLVSLAFTLGAAPAGAAPAWLSPVDLSVPVDLSAVVDGNTVPVKVAFDPQDTATAVWLRNDGQHYVVQAADRPAGGSWRKPVDISAPEQLLVEPDAAFDAAGNGVAVWRAQSGKDFVVRAAFRPAGGAWQPPVDLSPAGSVSLVHAAIDGHGNAVAAWALASGGKFVPKAAFRPAGGSWEAPVDLAPKAIDNIAVLQVALDAQGNGLAAWSGGGSAVQAAYRPAGGSWQGPADVPGSNGLVEDLAFDPNGNAVTIWTSTDGSVVRAAFRRAGGAWQAPVDLSAGADAVASPHIAFDPQGNAIAVWQYDGPNGSTVQARLRPAGGDWQATVDLAPARNAGPSIAVDTQGDALAVWSRQGDTGDNVVQARFRPAGGDWQPARDVSTAGQYAYAPEAAFDGQGDAVVAWQHSNAFRNGMVDVQAAGYDAAGPVLGGLSIPLSGTAGQPLSFAVSPLDAWSALGGTQWTFGNDGTATGATVTHTFAAPGAYPVTVSGTDALGNTTRATRNVTISPSQGVGGQSTTPPIVTPTSLKTVNAAKPRCRVPSLKGRTTTQATARLKKAKCRYSIRRRHSKVRARRVVSSRPSAGTTTTRVVVVDVSLGRRR